MAEGKRPIKKFAAGGMSVALWQNKIQAGGKEIETVSVTMERRYMDADGKWKSSSSLRANDLPRAILILQKSFDYIVSKKTDDSSPVTEEEVVM